MDDDFDVEAELFEARRTPSTSEERWAIAAHIATLIVRALPESRVTCGTDAPRSSVVDYITATPNPPLSVYGPDGRFIVSFVEDGSWIDAQGSNRSTAGIIEGSYKSLAAGLIRDAGLENRRRPSRSKFPRDLHHSDNLPRMLIPVATNTWRDGYPYPQPPQWPAETAPSICISAPDTRVILTGYDSTSCTYVAGYREPARWGIESLRIPVMDDAALELGDLSYPQQIHEGDCLVTIGSKAPTPDEHLETDDAEISGDVVWHPQRVVHVEPEGLNHQRVWLVVDNDVANEYVDPENLDISNNWGDGKTRVITGGERRAVLNEFKLDVFCSKCGNRGHVILYGMPDGVPPSYYAIGGCAMEPDQPDYECSCGHSWGAKPERSW